MNIETILAEYDAMFGKNSLDEIEEISQRIEVLLKEIDQLED